jgi:hypothetical protein
MYEVHEEDIFGIGATTNRSKERWTYQEPELSFHI